MDEALSSPRAWGCFCLDAAAKAVLTGLPHVRGGVSKPRLSRAHICASSPRAWGCFYGGSVRMASTLVFPTCVGVFPERGKKEKSPKRLPHVRGGVSIEDFRICTHSRSSPRAWGCFLFLGRRGCHVGVFPTCVGVFPIAPPHLPYGQRLPHVRGGVSSVLSGSPPTAPVFPTCVGVFLF